VVTPLAVPRGPRPWREARTRQDWLVLGAWLQLGAVAWFAALWLDVLGAAVAGVALARRHRRGAVSARTALGALLTPAAGTLLALGTVGIAPG
jgi:hypothetical protein